MGVVMKSCSFCVKNHRKCVVYSAKSVRCSECVRAKRRNDECDVEVEGEKTWDSEVPRSRNWTPRKRELRK
ncbi:hypothetical protein CJF30_00008052 [Rutstroemia sp. NJR-2017a BBW]|nr:hypothetical protein CJF30_00008052 [Rutstroemia sp. NJR-2017a BBW]